MLGDKAKAFPGVRANGEIMTLKVFTDVSSSLLGRASYVALAFVLSTATVAAADKGKPADATPAATAPAAPAATLGLAPGEIPSDLDSAIRQAQMNRRNGDFAEASKILGQLVLFAPDDPRVL